MCRSLVFLAEIVLYCLFIWWEFSILFLWIFNFYDVLINWRWECLKFPLIGFGNDNLGGYTFPTAHHERNQMSAERHFFRLLCQRSLTFSSLFHCNWTLTLTLTEHVPVCNILCDFYPEIGKNENTMNILIKNSFSY